MDVEYYGELVCLDAVFLTLIDHSGLLTVRWLFALHVRKPSCLCFLLALPFSYAVIVSPAGVSACTLQLIYIHIIHCVTVTIPNCHLSSSSLSPPLSFSSLLLSPPFTLSLSLCRATHVVPELPVIQTPSALRTCLTHPGAPLLAEDLVTWMPRVSLWDASGVWGWFSLPRKWFWPWLVLATVSLGTWQFDSSGLELLTSLPGSSITTWTPY